jgi:hypothetical protein
MESPTHKENLLNSRFTEIGVATASGLYNNSYSTVIVQVFGAPKLNSLLNKTFKPTPGQILQNQDFLLTNSRTLDESYSPKTEQKNPLNKERISYFNLFTDNIYSLLLNLLSLRLN